MIYELNYPATKLLQFALNHIFVLDDKITWCFFFFPFLRRIKDAFAAALFNWTLWTEVNSGRPERSVNEVHAGNGLLHRAT